MKTKFCAWIAIAGLLTACGDDKDGGTSDTSAETETTGASTTTASTTDTSTTDASTTDASTTDASTTAGSSSTDPSTSGPDTDSAGSTGSGATYSVSGTITRSVEPADGEDAIGDIYVGALETCSQASDSAASVVVMDADLSGDGSSVEYTITGVPEGTFYVSGFMDDNGNADPNDPDGCEDDLASAQILPPGPICVEVTVAGADVTGADIDLNLLIPSLAGC